MKQISIILFLAVSMAHAMQGRLILIERDKEFEQWIKERQWSSIIDFCTNDPVHAQRFLQSLTQDKHTSYVQEIQEAQFDAVPYQIAGIWTGFGSCLAAAHFYLTRMHYRVTCNPSNPKQCSPSYIPDWVMTCFPLALCATGILCRKYHANFLRDQHKVIELINSYRTT